MRKINVLVVDDHTVVRDGISSLLALAGDIDVVGEAANGLEGLDKVGKLVPDVVLIDIAMPIMNGLEAIRRMHKEFPEVKILVLTQYDDKEHVFPAIQAGASGFISKTAASSELTAGIRAVSVGESYLSPSIAKLFVDDWQRVPVSEGNHDLYEQLTDREREILKLVVEGYKTREIAEMLTISQKTVEGHKTSLMKKLGIDNKTGLVKYALRRGIISA
ncbi:MAG: response regulator transcription factor [Chloroflexota bacterium]|nr:response regulator transcription factor [Chloroflexota bacterium]